MNLRLTALIFKCPSDRLKPLGRGHEVVGNTIPPLRVHCAIFVGRINSVGRINYMDQTL